MTIAYPTIPVKIERALTNEERMSVFAETFPCLRNKPGVLPWNPQKLQRWASTVASSGERHCARFVLNVWNPYHKWRLGKFLLVEAMNVLDSGNREAMVRWIQNPWFP